MSLSQIPNLPVSIEFLPGERPAVRSVDVARHFGLKHKNVLRDIRDLMGKLPESFCGLNFEPTEAEVPVPFSGGLRKDPCYLLTRDAFTLLVMGWNSSRAIEWKLKYIEAFNALEAAAVENARLEAVAAGARAWLALPAPTREWLPRAIEYHKMGLNTEEVGKLLDVSGSGVARALQTARAMGMIPDLRPAKRRRRPNGQGRNSQAQGAEG